VNRFSQRIGDTAWGNSEPDSHVWTSGPWRVEVRGDELADIRYAGRPVLRSVRGVARDQDWETVPVAVREVVETDDGLDLTLDLVGLGADIDGRLGMRADPRTLSVTFDAYLRTSFRRSRIGIVVLQPASLAGTPMTVTSPSGAVVATRFPTELLPHQPALDIAGLAWESDGLSTALAFTGDVFEIEDQRNWTDGSFKTYSTPLSLPFPVPVEAGHEVHQSVTIRCTQHASVTLREAGRRWPAIGLGASTAAGTSPVIVALPVAHVGVELDAGSRLWAAALGRAAAEAAGRPLDVRVVADRAEQLAPVLDALAGHDVVRLAVYDRHSQVTEAPLWEALNEGATTRGLTAERHGGSRSHFTELSRARDRLPATLPGLSFALTPQMHATERAQLVESVPMQELVTAAAADLAGGRPVHVGPLTLRQRYPTAAATAPEPDQRTDVTEGYGAEHVPGATDPRQAAPALAAWTLAAGIAHARGGAASLTLFETWGPRGVVDAEGTPYPVAEAVAWLAEAHGAELWSSERPSAPDLWVAGAQSGSGTTLLVANLSDVPLVVTVTAPGEPDWTVDVEPYSCRRRLPDLMTPIGGSPERTDPTGVLRFHHHDSEGIREWR
jgi:hypothetical protein